MAIDINAARRLVAIAKSGHRFGRVLMIGRQEIIGPRRAFRRLFRKAGYGTLWLEMRNYREPQYAELLFMTLGATEVQSLDVSDYQGANIIADLNKPLTCVGELWDTVYDGGTLEHIYNVPTALQNLVNLTKVDGLLIFHNPTNGQSGHGFYQFSPEFYWSALFALGASIRSMHAHTNLPFARHYCVASPWALRERVELRSFWPVNLFVAATLQERIECEAPQQSDYQTIWEHGLTPPTLWQKLTARVWNLWRTSLLNRRYFKPE